MAGHPALQIELGDVADYQCPCCHRESQTVHGFIYDSSGSTSVYFAGYTHGHPEIRTNMVLSLGGWGEGTTPADRRAIALQVSAADGLLTFAFPPVEDSPWYGEEFLGEMVEPSDLSHEDRLRSEKMAKFVVEHDPRVAKYIKTGSRRAKKEPKAVRASKREKN